MINGVWAQSGICFNLTSCSVGYTAVGATASTQCVGQAWSPPTVSCPRKVFNPTLPLSTAMVMMVKKQVRLRMIASLFKKGGLKFCWTTSSIEEDFCFLMLGYGSTSNAFFES